MAIRPILVLIAISIFASLTFGQDKITGYYDPATGNVTADARDASLIMGYQISSDKDLLRVENHIGVLPTIHQFRRSDMIVEIVTNSTSGAVFDLGDVLPTGLGHDDLSQVELQFSLNYEVEWITQRASLPVSPAPKPIVYDRWASDAMIRYSPTDGSLYLDTEGFGAIASYRIKAKQGGDLTFDAPSFDPVIGGGRFDSADSQAVGEITDIGIGEGIYNLGTLLPPGLSLAAVQDGLIATFQPPVGQGSREISNVGLFNPFSQAIAIEMSFAAFDADPVIYSWTNPLRVEDVNKDGAVSPKDMLTLILDINNNGLRSLPELSAEPQLYLDVNSDGFVSGKDALTVLLAIEAANAKSPVAAAVPEPASAQLFAWSLLILVVRKRRNV